MRKPFCLLVIVLLAASVAFGQTPREEILDNVYKSGDVYFSYPGGNEVLTPAPKGYKPFYISHYGRHGSRWMTGESEYTRPQEILRGAHEAGKLTQAGEDLLKKVDILVAAADGRHGDLTPLGREQHQGIAERMFENFPQVFQGEANIDARSTVVIRCILSMDAACQKLKELNPKLQITNDASEHDMYYMNYPESKTAKEARAAAAAANASANAARPDYSAFMKIGKIFNGFREKHTHPERLMCALFTDTTYVRHLQMGKDKAPRDYSQTLAQGLYGLASGLQCTDLDMDLYNIFTEEEIVDLWALNTAGWYMRNGNASFMDQNPAFAHKNLLQNVLNTADSVIACGGRGATLRYGHDTVVLPLAILLELDNCAYSTSDLDSLVNNWALFRIVPMAANIQIVFYRNKKNDVLVKVLLNERESVLPIKTDIAPYYRWSDVAAYYRGKLGDM